MSTTEQLKKMSELSNRALDLFQRNSDQQVHRGVGSLGFLAAGEALPYVESFLQIPQSHMANEARFYIAIGAGLIFMATPIGKSIEWLGDEVRSAINLLRPKITTRRPDRS